MDKLISFLQPYARAARKGTTDKSSAKYFIERHQMSIYGFTSIAISTWLYVEFCKFQEKRFPPLSDALKAQSNDVHNAKLADWSAMSEHNSRAAQMREGMKR
ncbi:hypothetical protein DIPPA_14332 [Diplonema papillatum]|nr:hypothetical protein DIPPA_14332 [Diplonema papillatum]